MAYHSRLMVDYPTATLVASRFRRNLEFKNVNRLRTVIKDRIASETWSDFESSITALPGYVSGSLASGIGFWPGGAEPTAEFKVTGDILSIRNTAATLAKEFGQTAVRVNFEAAAEPMLFELDLWLADWRFEYLLAESSLAARSEAVWWLMRGSAMEMPGGRVIGNRLIIDAGLGFVARAHRSIAEKFGRPLSVASVLVERWGKDGEQRGFFSEQRIERAGESELGRILLA